MVSLLECISTSLGIFTCIATPNPNPNRDPNSNSNPKVHDFILNGRTEYHKVTDNVAKYVSFFCATTQHRLH
jgi:hypothetical protein